MKPLDYIESIAVLRTLADRLLDVGRDALSTGFQIGDAAIHAVEKSIGSPKRLIGPSPNC
jgi:hypothetical protein